MSRCPATLCVPVFHTEPVWTPPFAGERGCRERRCEREAGHDGPHGVDWEGQWVDWEDDDE